MDKDKIYIEEIKEFCQKVINFTTGVSYEQFSQDEKLQLAVVKLVENIGLFFGISYPVKLKIDLKFFKTGYFTKPSEERGDS